MDRKQVLMTFVLGLMFLSLFSVAFASCSSCDVATVGVDPNICEPGESCPTNQECCGPICNYNGVCDADESFPNCWDCIPKFPFNLFLTFLALVALVGALFFKDELKQKLDKVMKRG